jgi:NhaP-type Na+/H+ or K+/H+ antiporter
VKDSPVPAIGAFFFGLVVGWVTYRTLRREGSSAHISDLAAVIAAIGGSTITNVISEALFGWYSIGLAVGFFGYYGLSIKYADKWGKEFTIGENKEP